MKEYVPLMSERVLGGERLAADEGTTTIALQQRTPIGLDRENYDYYKIRDWCLGMVRTGAIYILPYEQLEPAWESLINMPLADLPPLPFPRIVLEAEEGGKPCTLLRGEVNETLLITVLEVEQGREWNVVHALDLGGEQLYFGYGIRREDTNDGSNITVHYPVGMSDYYDLNSEEETRNLKLSASLLMRMVVNAIQLITARNAPKVRQDMPRQQRRAFIRKYKIEPPTVYRVKLEQAGSAEGTAGWHYKVRFLVCGHWRHYSDGSRTWVHPYIKGPPSAPWKGRPVHEKESDE